MPSGLPVVFRAPLRERGSVSQRGWSFLRTPAISALGSPLRYSAPGLVPEGLSARDMGRYGEIWGDVGLVPEGLSARDVGTGGTRAPPSAGSGLMSPATHRARADGRFASGTGPKSARTFSSGYMAVTRRLHGGPKSARTFSSGYMALTWRLHGGYMAVPSRQGPSPAVTWRLHGGYMAVPSRQGPSPAVPECAPACRPSPSESSRRRDLREPPSAQGAPASPPPRERSRQATPCHPSQRVSVTRHLSGRDD